MYRVALISVVLAALLAVCQVKASFYVLETDDLRLVYRGRVHDYLVPHVARCFENAMLSHKRLFDYVPSRHVTLLLHDDNDFNTAGAGTAPWNSIVMAIAPPSYAFETMPANERINATLNHELAHVVIGDQATAGDRFFRSIFLGKVRETDDYPLTILYSYLTSPRRSTPCWYREGIAVFLETWMAGGLGRALSSYDEMVFRTAVLEGARFYDRVGLESEGTEVDFQVRLNSYLYGTRFMSYLALQYGPEDLLRWVSRVQGSKAYFAAQFTEVYGESLDREWSDWIEWEHRFQRANLDSIECYPLTLGRVLSSTALGAVSRGAFDARTRTLYVTVSYPGQVAFIAAIDLARGTIARLGEVKGPALYSVSSLAYDSSAGVLFYTTDNAEWRDLRAVDVHTGQSRTLIKDARIGDLAFNSVDKSLWGVRHFNGIATLVTIPPPYTQWNQVVSWPYGRNIYGLSISPDGGRLSAGLSYVNGRQILALMNVSSLLARDTCYEILFDFHNSIPANFVWSPDGEYLIGSSYYTGVSNIFRYRLADSVMQGASNCRTGLFNPVPVSPDSFVAFEYTSKGFVPVLMANRPVRGIKAISFLGQQVADGHPVVRQWVAGSPGAIKLDSLSTYAGRYRGLKSIRVASAYPIVEGYRNWPAYGVHTQLRDPINLHRINATATYTPNRTLPSEERLHVDVQYLRLNWSLRFKHNDGDFYDLFGPTKTSRKGNMLGFDYSHQLLQDGPRRMTGAVGLYAYWGLKKLPEYQNITTSFGRFAAFSAGLGYSHLRASLGSVDYEKGHAWGVAADSRYVNGKSFTRLHATFDYGVALRLHHSSLWMRSALGYSPNDRREPLANFYFGGFGNNWVDHGTIQRYRQGRSFPGLPLNEVMGADFAKLLLEWNLPPLRFRRFGVPTLYATWIRTAIFTTALRTNLGDRSYQRSLMDLGVQVDMRLVLLSHLPLTLSAGYAVAFERERRLSREFMLSLKVL